MRQPTRESELDHRRLLAPPPPLRAQPTRTPPRVDGKTRPAHLKTDIRASGPPRVATRAAPGDFADLWGSLWIIIASSPSSEPAEPRRRFGIPGAPGTPGNTSPGASPPSQALTFKNLNQRRRLTRPAGAIRRVATIRAAGLAGSRPGSRLRTWWSAFDRRATW